MKGIQGVIVAVALGILGAFCNWIYVSQQLKEAERIVFLSIAPDANIGVGDKFKLEHFARLPVPKSAAGTLEQSALKYDDANTIVGQAAARPYLPGQIVLRPDVDTPPPTDVLANLRPGEHAIFVPVDTQTTVTALLRPGNEVSFIIPRPVGPTPATAGKSDPSKSRILGPYRVLSMGTRMGSAEKLRASGGSASNENIMGVAVSLNASGQLEDRGQELVDALSLVGNQRLHILLHGKDARPR